MPTTHKQAEEKVKSGKYHQFYLEKQLSKAADMNQSNHVDQKAERREERRRKAASGKGGGGTQGRETKTKAVKKHSRSKHTAHDSESDDGSNTVKKPLQLDIIGIEDVEKTIKPTLENEGLDDLLTKIAEYLLG